MKKPLSKIVFILSGLLTLTSCVSLGDLLSSRDDQSSTSIPPDIVDNVYKPNGYVYDNDYLGKTWDVATWRSVGDQKMLVVPVKFSDTSPTYGNDTTIVNTLNKAFFGASSDTGWESLTSYYEKSSYGALKITGEVLTPFNLGYSTATLEAKPKDDQNYWDQTHYVLESIYNTLSAEKLKEYDVNKDGHVDSVFLVYLAPVKDNSDLYWAYQYYWNRYSNETKPTFNTYAWASYEFMYDELPYSTLKPSAHTFIHETGHLLGLDDYYDYDGKVMPVGGYDMMDFNIIDHNMYSKYLNNWSLPFVPVGEADITLRPAEASGDFILLNKNWNGHVYDEYILIEYYTPTGLNQKDAFDGYGSVSAFTVPGVRIFHVDSRIRTHYSQTDVRWTDQILAPSSTQYTDIATSNTTSKSVNASYKKIHLLDGDGRSNTWYHSLVKPDNKALFQTGAKIEIGGWQKYLFDRATFNDGSEIGFSVEIGAMTNEGVQIKIRTA
ncbi:MAG: hypothetical protein RBS24_03240 [Bacilli bacterium]|nr:hypothetical protein [Bacilli bacterium]